MDLTIYFIAIGGFLVSVAVLCAIAVFLMKEKTYEEMIEEQRQKSGLLDDVKKVKDDKKKSKKEKKKKKEEKDTVKPKEKLVEPPVERQVERQVETHPKEDKMLEFEIEAEQISEANGGDVRNRKNKKNKKDRDVHGILLNKTERPVIKERQVTETEFRKLPKDEVEMEYDRRSRHSSFSEHTPVEDDKKKAAEKRKNFENLLDCVKGIKLNEKDIKGLITNLQLEDKWSLMKKAKVDKWQEKINLKEAEVKELSKRSDDFERRLYKVQAESDNMQKSYKESSEKILSERDKLSLKFENMEKDRLNEINQLRHNVIAANEKISQFNQQNVIVTTELNNQVAECTALKQRLANIDQQQQKKANMIDPETLNKLDQLKKENDELRKKNENAEKMKPAYEHLQQQLNDFDGVKDDWEKKLKSSEESSERLAKDLKERDSNLEAQKNALKAESEKLKNATQEIESLKASVEELKKSNHEQNSFREKVTELEKKLKSAQDDKTSTEDELRKVTEELTKKNDEVSRKIEETKQKALEEYNNICNANGNTEAEMRNLRKENQELREGCQKATNALAIAETDAENIRKDLNNKAKALDRLHSENKDLQERESKLRSELASAEEKLSSLVNSNNDNHNSFELLRRLFPQADLKNSMTDDEVVNLCSSYTQDEKLINRLKIQESTLVKTKNALDAIESSFEKNEAQWKSEKQDMLNELAKTKEELENLRRNQTELSS